MICQIYVKLTNEKFNINVKEFEPVTISKVGVNIENGKYIKFTDFYPRNMSVIKEDLPNSIWRQYYCNKKDLDFTLDCITIELDKITNEKLENATALRKSFEDGYEKNII